MEIPDMHKNTPLPIVKINGMRVDDNIFIIGYKNNPEIYQWDVIKNISLANYKGMKPGFIELKNLGILEDSDNVLFSNIEISKTEHEIIEKIYDFVYNFVEKSRHLNYFNEKEIITHFNIEFRSYFNYDDNIIKLYRPYPIGEDMLYMELNMSKYEEVLTWILGLVEQAKK